MNAMLILLVSVVVLVLGYVLYGGWLARQWGVKADRTTPAHEYEDGRDFVPAPPYVVLGHHFSSIAGAGPINGPIQAAIFGWVPVLLWVLIGGIFIGAMHDFGALFASIRHKGQTLATVIQENVDGMAKRLFCIFAYLTLILVVAAFASIVAGTFAVSPVPADAAQGGHRRDDESRQHPHCHDLGAVHRRCRRLRPGDARTQDSRFRQRALGDRHHRARRHAGLSLPGHRARQHDVDAPHRRLHPARLGCSRVDLVAAA